MQNHHKQFAQKAVKRRVTNDSTLKLLELTVDSIRECISITDMEDNLIYVNQAFLDTYGYSREEILGQNISVIRSTQNSPDSVRGILPGTIKDGKWEGELFNKSKSGRVFLISLRSSIVKDRLGNPVALVGAAIDLTEREDNARRLREAENKYHSLFSDLKDAVFEVSSTGRLLDINPYGLDLMGYGSKKEALGLRVNKEFGITKTESKSFYQELESKGFVKDRAMNLQTKNGTLLRVLITASLLKDEHGSSKSFRGIIRDITKIQEAEHRLTNSIRELAKLNQELAVSRGEYQKLNDVKDKFFSVIAHDLKSPFTALLGFSDMITDEIHDLSLEEIYDYASRIKTSAYGLFHLLEDLLQWSRFQSGQIELSPERFDLSVIANRVMALFEANASQKSISLESNIDPGLRAYADKNMIQSVIRNIISNALKFTPQGGKVQISAKEAASLVEICIEDTGIGINGQDAEKIFSLSSYHSTPGTNMEKGTGLGMVIAKEMITKNRGKIWIKSSPGKGTAFYFVLPRG